MAAWIEDVGSDVTASVAVVPVVFTISAPSWSVTLCKFHKPRKAVCYSLKAEEDKELIVPTWSEEVGSDFTVSIVVVH